jgi:hypothetical protein
MIRTLTSCANIGYHIVHILLYAEPTLQDESYVPLIQEQAMQITNIAISDFPAALKVFSTHGLFYGTFVIDQSPHSLVQSRKGRGTDSFVAAKHIQGISRKARIWNVLKDVEADTGYNTRATVKHLQDLVEQDSL